MDTDLWLGSKVRKRQIPRLWVFTGEVGAGKTLTCQHLVEEAREQGWNVAGILSPGVYQEGHKVAIEAVDLRRGERRLLARRRKTGEVAGVHTREWWFDPAALAWGNTVLETAVPCDLLVVDEIGPLELEYGQGWVAALAALASRAYRLGVVVLRPSLLPLAARWAPVHVLAIRQPNPVLRLPDLMG